VQAAAGGRCAVGEGGLAAAAAAAAAVHPLLGEGGLYGGALGRGVSGESATGPGAAVVGVAGVKDGVAGEGGCAVSGLVESAPDVDQVDAAAAVGSLGGAPLKSSLRLARPWPARYSRPCSTRGAG